ncbi:MAG: hypothetical protein AAB503_00070 [Patescibacteria group bacterium]
MQFEKIQNRIKEIQRAEDTVKRKWLIALSSFFIAVVIGIWFALLNTTIPLLASKKINTASSTEIAGSATQQKEDGVFFNILGRGFVEIWGNILEKTKEAKSAISEKVTALGKLIKQDKEFSVTGKDDKFVPEQ